MGFVKSKRPVVLVVEDEFLLRMDAVDMIAAVGFEVVARPGSQGRLPPIKIVATSGHVGIAETL